MIHFILALAALCLPAAAAFAFIRIQQSLLHR